MSICKIQVTDRIYPFWTVADRDQYITLVVVMVDIYTQRMTLIKDILSRKFVALKRAV